MKLYNSGLYEVRLEMESLVYCVVLEIRFHKKPTKSLPPPYYDVPQVSDSIRYRLVLEIGHSSEVHSEMELDFTQNPPNNSSSHITMFIKFWIQSDIDWSMMLDNSSSYEVRYKMEWSVYCIVLVIGFHSKPTK
ncbi:unnamed protein product [Prunus brigantina]